MTWTKVGTDSGGHNALAAWSNTTLSDLRICEILNFSNKTVTVSTLTGGGCNWTPITPKLGINLSYTASLFLGTISATGSQTPSLTWSGTAPASWGWASQMFHSTVGSWFVDKQGNIDSLAGTTTWASLTPTASGALYWGYSANATTSTAGSTSGYVWNANIDTTQDGCAYNLNCAGGSATNPVWGDNGQQFGMMVLLAEGSAAAAKASGRVRRPLILGAPFYANTMRRRGAIYGR